MPSIFSFSSQMVPNHTDWKIARKWREWLAHRCLIMKMLPFYSRYFDCGSQSIGSVRRKQEIKRWFRNQKEKSTLSLSSKVVKYHPCTAVQPLHHKISGNFVFQTFSNIYYTNFWKGHFPGVLERHFQLFFIY